MRQGRVGPYFPSEVVPVLINPGPSNDTATPCLRCVRPCSECLPCLISSLSPHNEPVEVFGCPHLKRWKEDSAPATCPRSLRQRVEESQQPEPQGKVPLGRCPWITGESIWAHNHMASHMLSFGIFLRGKKSQRYSFSSLGTSPIQHPLLPFSCWSWILQLGRHQLQGEKKTGNHFCRRCTLPKRASNHGSTNLASAHRCNSEVPLEVLTGRARDRNWRWDSQPKKWIILLSENAKWKEQKLLDWVIEEEFLMKRSKKSEGQINPKGVGARSDCAPAGRGGHQGEGHSCATRSRAGWGNQCRLQGQGAADKNSWVTRKISGKRIQFSTKNLSARSWPVLVLKKRKERKAVCS